MPRALVLVALGGAPGCAARPIEAVVLGPVDGGGDGALAPPISVWPNLGSSANSDPWIAEHHDQIGQIQPQVLLLDFANRFVTESGTLVPAGYDLAATLQPIVQAHVDAFAVASQYHGYKDPSAPPFLRYQIAKIVDLRDSGTGVNSALVPLTSSGAAVDYAQLDSPAFARLMGFADPSSPGAYLNMCSLFERGIVNEVWAMTADPVSASDPPTVKFDAVAETKQAYGADGRAISGNLRCTTPTCIDRALPCAVTTRIYDFNPGRGSGCHLFDAGLVWQSYLGSGVLPAFAKVGRTFFNLDFDERFGASFQSFSDVCQSGAPPDAGACIAWPSATHAVSGPASSKAFDFSPMSAGCGNVIFPPNATAPSVQAGDMTVLTSCENYGLHNGPGGADLATPYTNAIAQGYYQGEARVATDCGGTQPTYLLASMPGLATTATGADGSPMRNWWVYLFY
jgi:hypothetical protein